MSIFAFSANHSNTSQQLRESLAVLQDNLSACYSDILKLQGVQEAFILSTCNRTEIYALCDSNNCFNNLLKTFFTFQGVDSEDYDSSARTSDIDTCAHLLRVGCGMESMVIGEPQIFGQLKSAYAKAKQHGALGSELEQLLQFCFARIKEIRTHMPLGREPVSIASTTVKLIKQIFDSFADKNLLMVGAGETIELAARYVTSLGISNITITNRTIEKAFNLAEKFTAKSAPLYELPNLLSTANLVITATASQLPIIGKGMVERAMQDRRDHTLAIFDLAIPGDVEKQVKDIDNVFVYTIEDLGKIIEQNKSQRQHAVQASQKFIDQAIDDYQKLQRQARIGKQVISPFRSRVETLRDKEISNAMRSLARGDIPEYVVLRLAENLTKKFLHLPSVKARKNDADIDTLLQILLDDSKDTSQTRH